MEIHNQNVTLCYIRRKYFKIGGIVNDSGNGDKPKRKHDINIITRVFFLNKHPTT